MKDNLPKVFADTNIWFSYFYGSINCKKIIEAHVAGKINLVISERVLIELVKNLQLKIPKSLHQLETFIEAYPPLVIKNPMKISAQVKTSIDKKDQIIFQAAVNAKIKYFVTGNRADFDIDKLYTSYKVKVLTPTEAIKELHL